MDRLIARSLAVLMFAGVLVSPVAAQKKDPCDDFKQLQQMEKEAKDKARENIKSGEERKTAQTTLETKGKEEQTAKTAEETAADADKQAKDNLQKRAKDLQDAQVKKTEAQQKLDEITQKIATLSAQRDASTQQGQEFADSGTLTNLESVEKPKAEQALKDATDKEAEANKIYEAAKTHEAETAKTLTEKKEAHKKATGEREKADAAVKAADKKTTTTDDTRKTSHGAWLNKFRDLSISARRCKDYKPSALGIALTMTKWKTAMNITNRLFAQQHDPQKKLFGGGKPAAGGTGASGTGSTGVTGDDLLAGFGSSVQLPKTLSDNLRKRLDEANEAYRKRQKELEKMWQNAKPSITA